MQGSWTSTKTLLHQVTIMRYRYLQNKHNMILHWTIISLKTKKCLTNIRKRIIIWMVNCHYFIYKFKTNDCCLLFFEWWPLVLGQMITRMQVPWKIAVKTTLQQVLIIWYMHLLDKYIAEMPFFQENAKASMQSKWRITWTAKCFSSSNTIMILVFVLFSGDSRDERCCC